MSRCGFLYKKGAIISGWKRRWFVLDGRKLRYYRKQGDTNAAGEILLDEESLAYHSTDGKDKDKPYMFCIKTKNRTYEIAASSKEEMEGWVEDTMRAALGVVERRSSLRVSPMKTRVVGPVEEEPWLRFRCVGCWCETCWESVPDAVRAIAGVEVVRLDAGREILVVKRKGEVAEQIIATLEEQFGFIVTLLEKGRNA